MTTKQSKASYDFTKSQDNQNQQQKPPQFVNVACCAQGCIFTQKMNAAEPRPFICAFHQKAERKYWPNVSRNIKQYFMFYKMGNEYLIERKFDKFVDTEPEMLTRWAYDNGVQQLAPRKIRTAKGFVYERCYDFGARLLDYFRKNVVMDFMEEEKKLSLQETLEKQKKEKVDKTFGLIKAFNAAMHTQKNIRKQARQPQYPEEEYPF